MMTKHTGWELQYDVFDEEETFEVNTVSILFSNEADARAVYNALREEKKNMPFFRDDDDGMGFVWAKTEGYVRSQHYDPLMCVSLYPNVNYYTTDESVSVDDLPKE